MLSSTAGSTGNQFSALIKEHELMIHKICSIYAYTNEDREDLFQEIVLQLWNSFARFRGDSKFSTWLYRVGINTAIGGLKKRKPEIRSLPHDEIYGMDIPDHSVGDDQLPELYHAIAQLNAVEKAMVMLYLDDKSYEEMEEIMGISSGTLRVKMNRVKDKLRKLTKQA